MYANLSLSVMIPQFLEAKMWQNKPNGKRCTFELEGIVCLFFLMHFAFRLSFLNFTNFPYFLKEEKLRKWKHTDLAFLKDKQNVMSVFYSSNKAKKATTAFLLQQSVE